MKKIVRLVGCLIGVFVLGVPESWATGTAEGNGGVAKVCRAPNGRIRSAELLDIYEGSVLPPQLTFVEPGLPVGTQVDLAQLKLASNQAFLALFVAKLAYVRTHITFLPQGTGIVPTNDAFPVIMQRGCEYENVANFMDDGNIIIDREIFNELSPLNQAALYVHEVVYAIARDQVYEQSSVRSRRLVAHLMAQNGDVRVIQTLMRELGTRPTPPEPSYQEWRGLPVGRYRSAYHGNCEVNLSFSERGIDLVHGSRRYYPSDRVWWEPQRRRDSCRSQGRVATLECSDFDCNGAGRSASGDEYSYRCYVFSGTAESRALRCRVTQVSSGQVSVQHYVYQD